MKNLLIISVLLLVGSNGFGQMDTVFITHDNDNYDTLEYVTDTVLFKSSMGRHIITGTSVLNSSRKNESSKNYGFNLFDLKMSPCERGKEFEKGKLDEVISVNKENAEWSIDVNVNANCCYSFLGEIEIVNDTIMNIIYHGYGTYCFCNCCFGLTYTIKIWDIAQASNIKYFTINDDKKTLVKIE